MTDQIRARVLDCLTRVVPEADPASIRADVPLRDQLDIDSMDFMHFVIELDEALHVAVPESDYAEISTLNGCVRYLSARVPGAPAG
jgi:acyl carrier protein